ncbi:MAG: M42 family metallopeptidase [Thermoflexales bacterium]|nr:M42 family metallopeptidase [Thermoflexales bacterium]
MDSTEQLLQALTDAHGVPGYEAEVRAVIRRYLDPLGQVVQDKIGSVICKLGDGSGPRVLLAGHMDEVGFMVRHITKEGFIKFIPLGGWWDHVLLGQRVVIKTSSGDVLGIIGAKPPHLISADERKKMVEKKDMYIDIGASSAEEVAAAGVRMGDPVVPDSRFTPLAGGKTYLAKAFDNRVGCALMIQAAQHFAAQPHPNTVYGVATVMEEVGLRGAVTSVEMVSPDVALVLESEIAGDVPGIKEEECAIKLGGGPSVMFYDACMIPNLKLRDLVIDTARELDVPLQFSTMEHGATDGGEIHLHKTGVPTVVLGVPSRHIHSHGAIIHRDDYDRAARLVIAVVGKLDAATVSRLVE